MFTIKKLLQARPSEGERLCKDRPMEVSQFNRLYFTIYFILSIFLSGLPCPALVDYKWCGSARNCKTGYFKW